MSVSCALWATSLNQWARRYIRLTQPARCSPEKRARIRAFYANGVDKMHTPWAVEGLPMLLHLSLFLFFGGLAIYLFNVDQEVFSCVVSWIGLFSVVYGIISLLPLIRQDSPYNTPLSTPLWFLFSIIIIAVILTFIFSSVILFFFWESGFIIWHSCRYLCGMDSGRLRREWMESELFLRTFLNFHVRFSYLDKVAEESAEKHSPVIDGRILGWTVSALGDDNSLEKFFEAMPGFFDSELVKDLREHVPYDLLRNALAGFLGHTLSSKSVIYSVKLRRLGVFMDTIHLIGEDSARVSSILEMFLIKRWNLAPQTVEVAHILARLCTSNDQVTAQYARCIVARVLGTVRERDDRWIELAARISGLPELDLRDDITPGAGGGNMFLSILIDLCRQASRSQEWRVVKSFAEFDIRNTLRWLQDDFCSLWNEFVDQATRDPRSAPIRVLDSIRPLHIVLHQGADAAPIEDSASGTGPFLWSPSQYPRCNIHSLDSPPQRVYSPEFMLPFPVYIPPVPNSGLFIPPEPSDSPHSSPHHSTSDGITESSQETPTATYPTLPAHTSPYSTQASLPGVVAAPQDIPPVAKSSHPLGGTAQQDIIAPFEGPDIAENLPTVSASVPPLSLLPVPSSTPPVLNKSLASSNAGSASASNPFFLQPSSSDVGFSTPASPPSFRIPLFPDAGSLALLNTTTPSRPAGNTTLPRLRARGLMNTKNVCFANAMLQLLVRSPLFWDLFKELGDLNVQRGARDLETGGGATPLVDATVRFFEEFAIKEVPPPVQQQPQQNSGTKPREDEEANNSFEPIYMYDVMREKRQLKRLLVRYHVT